MIYRIGIGLIVLAASLLAYDSFTMLAARGRALEFDPANIVVPGGEEADLDVIAYIDYTDNKSRSLMAALREAAQQDGRVRVAVRPVAKEPGAAEDAGAMALAAGRQGRFAQAHAMLIKEYRATDENYAPALARETGMDEARFLADFKDPEIRRKIARARTDLAGMKSTAVPSVLIGRRIVLRVFGPVPTDTEFLTLFKDARRA